MSNKLIVLSLLIVAISAAMAGKNMDVDKVMNPLNLPSVDQWEPSGIFGFFNQMFSRFQQFSSQVASATSDFVSRGLVTVGFDVNRGVKPGTNGQPGMIGLVTGQGINSQSLPGQGISAVVG